MNKILGNYDRSLFWVTIIVVTFLCGFAILFTDIFQVFWSGLNKQVYFGFGWIYLLCGVVCLPFAIILACTKFGNLKLGEPQDKPEYSTFTWVSMLLSAGIGVGVYFWSVSEPMLHFMRTPYLAEPGSEAAMSQAMAITFLHWGFTGWAMFILVGLAVAYASYRLKQTLSFSSALYGLIGKRVNSHLGHFFDQLCSFITVVGIASIIGLGILSLSFAFGKITGIETTVLVQVLVAVSLAILYTASATAGLEKGMARLSNINIYIAMLIALFVFLAGPTNFIVNLLCNGMGAYLDGLVFMTFWTDASKESDSWSSAWTLFYWSWYFSWTPFMGGFIARISKGRTVRQVLLGGIVLPSLMSFVWFGIMGGAGIGMHTNGELELWESIQLQTESGIFVMLGLLPLGEITVVVGLLSLILFQATSGDAGTNYVSILFSKGNPNPTVGMKLVCAAVISLLPISMIIGGGLKAVQTMVLVLALPVAVIFLMILGSIVRMVQADPNAKAELRAYNLGETFLWRDPTSCDNKNTYGGTNCHDKMP